MNARRWLSRCLLGLWLACLGTSCINVTPAGTYFDSNPPGAEVLIDGKRSGYVTPCLIGLSRGRSYDIGLRLEGYEPRRLQIRPNGRVEWVTWDDGAMAPDGIGGPFGLGFSDLVLPRRTNDTHAPNRIYLRLEPAAQGAE